MWSNRGAFVERRRSEALQSQTRDETFVSEASLPNASAKLLLFSDMAMGWSGLRAVLVRIACNHAPGYPGYLGYLGYPTCVFFLKVCYI